LRRTPTVCFRGLACYSRHSPPAAENVAMDNSGLDSVVDLQRYPIDERHSGAGRKLVEELRRELRDEGQCRLGGFLRPTAVERLVTDVLRVEHHAYFGLTEASPYFNDRDASLPDDHPRNIRTRRELGLVAADLIPPASGLHRLYESDVLREFFAALLDKETLHPLADPFQKVSITVMPAGAGHNWHFDDADFTITLMLRKPERGGAFECVPKLRSTVDENYDGVREVLLGRRDNVQVVGFEPGTLMVFRGRYSLHRVSPVEGDVNRLVAILTYSTEPNWMGTPRTNELVFGPRIDTVA